MGTLTMHPRIRTCRARQEIRGVLAGKDPRHVHQAEIKAQVMMDHGASPSRAIEYALSPFRCTRIAVFLGPDTYGEQGSIRQQVPAHPVHVVGRESDNQPPPSAA